jgi:hypothetical protein
VRAELAWICLFSLLSLLPFSCMLACNFLHSSNDSLTHLTILMVLFHLFFPLLPSIPYPLFSPLLFIPNKAVEVAGTTSFDVGHGLMQVPG